MPKGDPLTVNPLPLRNEFDRVFRARVNVRSFAHTTAIVVLSGEVSERHGQIPSKNHENRARVRYGAFLQRRIREIRRVSPSKREEPRPPIFVIGTEEQLADLQKLATEAGCLPPVVAISCGIIGQANTRTQFLAIKNRPQLRDAEHLTVVTSRFHIPRVIRTADMLLAASQDFSVVGPPPRHRMAVEQSRVADEIRRIGAYAERGDLQLVPKRGRVGFFTPSRQGSHLTTRQ